MATPITTLKWRLQLQRASLVDSEYYYIEYNSDVVTKQQLSDLVKSLQGLGYVNVSFGLLVSLP